MSTKTKLPPEIEDLDDFTESMNFLIHSDTGAGKTVLTAKLPKLLILAIEEGTISAKRMGSKAKVWKVKHWDQFVRAYEWLRDSLEDGTCPFEWVLIDSITAAQTRCLRAIMETAVANNPKRDPDIPAIQDHFKWQLSMKRMVTDFNELPINVMWLARSMNKEDPDGNDIVVPLIEGKDYQISAWVCGEMHLVAYLKKIQTKSGKTARKLYTNEHPMYWCKDRYNVLDHEILNPDINKIVDQIKSSETGRPSLPANTALAAKKKATAKKAAGKSGRKTTKK